MPANRLAQETSAYLLQHAHNPVDWYPWSDEAFERARKLDRPIFLSVGYSSCHWCHVMERESFEDEAIARILNENFIAVKVDREERPDVDAIYMEAVQLLTQQGGWPMSVCLDHERRPFWGGTYFPPQAAHGRPGFGDVLEALTKAWREDRAQITETATELTGHLAHDALASIEASGLPGEEAFAAALAAAEESHDERFGGFGQAPKFPRAVDLALLLRIHHRTSSPSALAMAERTLQAMACGGLFDQIGGGFHRYSVDAFWLVPHFEKMLYDNALLARTYVEAWQLTGKDFYAGVAAEVLDYLRREMQSPEGGFYAATDADSEGEEGRFFVWRPEELTEILGPDRARIAAAYWGITEAGNFEGQRSIPHIARAAPEVAEELGLSVKELVAALDEIRPRLYAARQERPRPFRDEKILTAWNGLAISALALGAQALGRDDWLLTARQTARRLLASSTRAEDGRLLRLPRVAGRPECLGFLDDHAYLAEGLLDLYEASFELEWLGHAERLLEFVVNEFAAASGGFHLSARDQETVLHRRRELFEGATPAASAVVARSLLRLDALRARKTHRAIVEATLAATGPLLERAPLAGAGSLLALDFLLHAPREVTIHGPAGAESTLALARVARRAFLPARVLAGPDPSGAGPELLGEAGAQGEAGEQGEAFASICHRESCGVPLTAPEALAEALSRP